MKRLLAVLMVAGLVAVGCSSSDDEESGSSDAPPVSLSGQTNDKGTATAGDDLALELDDNYFEPTFIKARAGQSVSIELENEGSNPHTFTSTALGVDEEVPAGAKKTVTVTAPAAGNAEFQCRFHQAAGMRGAVFLA